MIERRVSWVKAENASKTTRPKLQRLREFDTMGKRVNNAPWNSVRCVVTMRLTLRQIVKAKGSLYCATFPSQ